MPRPRELLQRFRLAGAPGAAGAGVPADRRAEAEAELGPVLELLDDAQARARGIRDEATDRAASLRRQAVDEASGRLAEARSRVPEWRRQAAAELVRQRDQELAGMRRAADEQVAATRSRTTQRLPEYVDRLVEAVLAEGPPGPESGRDPT